jgi:hypothetical protein
MPKQNQPITHRPKVEDENTGTGSERHGKHREQDEALPGRGDEKGGLSRYSGESTQPSRSAGERPQGEHDKRNPRSWKPGSREKTG